MSKIVFLIMDVDGTLTDGKIYMGNDGEIMKAFDIKDGYAIIDMIIPAGIIPVIITGRESFIVANRCRELGIEYVYQGVSNKVEILEKILKEKSMTDCVEYSCKNCAYIGDDIPDLACMKVIKAAGGVIACPADACREVIGVCDYVCSREAGKGAVREFIEWILENKNKRGEIE